MELCKDIKEHVYITDDSLQLTDLPDEIILEIMKNLDFAGALKTGQTCKRFHR